MNWFTDEYINRGAVKDNIVQLYLYKMAIPLSNIFVMFHIRPNSITVLSIIFSLLAFMALILENGVIYYVISWGISLHLDYCDGTVARMTGNLRKSAFRFDHMSDIFKISLIIIGIGMRYQNYIIWVLSFLAMFAFLYLTILNHEYTSYNKIKIGSSSDKEFTSSEKDSKNNILLRWIKNNSMSRNIFSFFFTLNGHTLLWFFIIPFGYKYVIIFLIYFMLLSTIRAINNIKVLSDLPKI